MTAVFVWTIDDAIALATAVIIGGYVIGLFVWGVTVIYIIRPIKDWLKERTK